VRDGTAAGHAEEKREQGRTSLRQPIIPGAPGAEPDLWWPGSRPPWRERVAGLTVLA